MKSLRRHGNETATELTLTPVAPDGTPGEPATCSMNWV